MDDFRIPWWLVLLLTVGIVALAVWQSSRWKLELRLGAGLLALVYLALLVVAIGGSRLPLLPGAISSISLVAAVLLTGRPSFRGQLIWFGLMTLCNAGVCILTGNAALATALAVSAVPMVVLLVTTSSQCNWIADLLPVSERGSTQESRPTIWLAGMTGVVLAVVLIGTSYYALHAESTRATTTRRHSALPSRSRIRTVLKLDLDREQSTSVVDLAAGRRADVVLLLTILAFVSLASAMTKPANQGITTNTDAQ